MAMYGFRMDNLRGDLFGGLTAGIVALPLALAFGEASVPAPSLVSTAPLLWPSSPRCLVAQTLRFPARQGP